MTEAPIYLTARQVAERFQISESALAAWRMKNKGLPYKKFCGKILYSLKDVEEFEKQNTITPKEK
jgi:Helix-turn-helix domain